MIGTNELIVGGLLVLAILVVVLIFALRTAQKSPDDVTFAEALPDDDPLVSPREFQAAPIAEMIEERVRRIAADDPSLAGLDVDFGTGQDGGLEIWVNAERYTSVDDIQNEILREAIKEAVEEYNKGL